MLGGFLARSSDAEAAVLRGTFAEQFLQGFRGRFLQCDGYDGYDRLTRIQRAEGPWTLVHCWSHLRRRFVKQLRNTKSPIAEVAVRQIAALYAIEATVRGAPPQIRLEARTEHSAPIIAALKPWFEKQLSMISSGSQLATDIRYALAYWDGLTRFLEDGRLELDTNPVENAIRPVALTRKNALFAGHEVGAENWALLASIVATCKLGDVNPVAYIAETLQAIIDGHPQSRIRGADALELPESVKPERIGNRQGAYVFWKYELNQSVVCLASANFGLVFLPRSSQNVPGMHSGAAGSCPTRPSLVRTFHMR